MTHEGLEAERPARKREPAEKPRRLLEAGASVFSRDGYTRATVEHLAERIRDIARAIWILVLGDRGRGEGSSLQRGEPAA